MAKQAKPKLIEIKNWRNGSVIAAIEAESFKDAVAKHLANKGSLEYADLRNQDMRGSDMSYSNMSYSNMSYSNMSYSNMSYSNMSYSDMRGSNMSYSNMSYSDMRGSRLPSPTAILLATWGDLSQQLCADLMLFDAESHPDPTAFDRWAAGGSCPYDGVLVERAANFTEHKEHWGTGQHCRTYDLMTRVLAEKCPEWSEEKRAEFAKRFEEMQKKMKGKK